MHVKTEINGIVYHKYATAAAGIEREASKANVQDKRHQLYYMAAINWHKSARASRAQGESYADKRFDFCVNLLKRAGRDQLVKKLMTTIATV